MSSGEMPHPVSSTANSILSLTCAAKTVTRPPFELNFIALDTKFPMILTTLSSSKYPIISDDSQTK